MLDQLTALVVTHCEPMLKPPTRHHARQIAGLIAGSGTIHRIVRYDEAQAKNRIETRAALKPLKEQHLRALKHKCPKCNAEPEEWCRNTQTPNGRKPEFLHRAREILGAKALKESTE